MAIDTKPTDTQPPQEVAREEIRAGRVVHTGGSPESDPRRLIPELGFRDYWYPLIGSSEIPGRKPRLVKILGQELCVFRGANGVAALDNFCPHRGARLSGGDCHYKG